jgi:hypothetical protein
MLSSSEESLKQLGEGESLEENEAVQSDEAGHDLQSDVNTKNNQEE